MPPPQPALPVKPAESAAGEEINDVLGDVGAEPEMIRFRHVFAKWPECHNLASNQMFLWIFDNSFLENAKISNFLTNNVPLW